jgi:hypothetical protein
MKVTLKKSTAKKSLYIVLVLALVNVFAFFVAFNLNKKFQEASHFVQPTEQVEVVKNGWQILHWSYSLLEYFNGSRNG